MAKQSPAQQKTVARVMHAFKEGDLEKRDGTPVEDPKQAIAIALHEAGASNQEDAATNRRNLRRTKRKEQTGQTARDESDGRRATRTGETRADLYAQARRKNIAGRSKMSKDQLARAVQG